MQVSKVEIDDLSIIRVINDEAIPAVNSVSMEEFVWFHKNSIYFKKVSLDESLAGFLLVLPMNIPYKSLNYTWFSKRYDNFAYIDRIAVKEEFKGSGIGTLLYKDLEKSLPKEIKMIACEYNLKPMNLESEKFHLAIDYERVGSLVTENGAKEVSLMLKNI